METITEKELFDEFDRIAKTMEECKVCTPKVQCEKHKLKLGVLDNKFKELRG